MAVATGQPQQVDLREPSGLAAHQQPHRDRG